jgi:Integral membrane protein TerC family
MSAIGVIVVADISLSLDNVLAVAGVAHGNRLALGFGLLLSVILMAVASTYVAKLLTKYSRIQWVGLLVILFVSCEMLLEGSHEIETKILHFNFIPYLIGLVMLLHMWLHDRYILAGDEALLKQFLSHHYFEIMSGLIVLVVMFVIFGTQIHDYIWTHPAMGLTGIVILL